MTEAVMPATRFELAALEHFLAEVSVPIFYEVTTGADPIAIGTGTLLEVAGRLVLVTANHLFDDDADTTKFSSPLDRKRGEVSTWGDHALYRPKSSDQLDVALVELSYPAIVAAMRKNFRRLTLAQIAMPTLGATHILAGYPSALTTVTATAINQTPFGYYSEMIAEPQGLVSNRNPALDLFFRLDAEAELFSGKVEETPRLNGASGCVIWELSRYDGPVWTPENALRAIGVQRSAKPADGWFRATNWRGVVPVLAQLDLAAANELEATLRGTGY